MIAGLDSTQAPTSDQARAAYAAGVRVWGGYLVTASDAEVLANRALPADQQGMFGLLRPWLTTEFGPLQAAGLRAIAYCSGNDDPAALAAKAAALGLLGALDDEDGIRPDGPWVQPWLDASGFGLYGNIGVHSGRRAPFHVVAFYPGTDPGATWLPGLIPPPTPHGWQWQGSHIDPVTGLEVDSSWFDDAFAPRGGVPMLVSCLRPDGGRDTYAIVGGQCRHVVTDFFGAIVFTDTLPGAWSAAIACGYRGTEPFFQGLGLDVAATPFEVTDPGPGWTAPVVKP